MSLRADASIAIRATWLIVAVIGMIAVVAPLVVSADSLHGLFPVCEARARGGSCALCGMTTGFIFVSQGEIEEARRANAGAPVLYAVLVLNFLVALPYSITMLLRRRTGDHHSCNLSH
jgi:hypothetical protein